MSQSTTKTASSVPMDIARAATDAWALATQALVEGRACDVPDEVIQQLLAAGVRLFAQKVDEERRYFSPVPEGSGLTATDVAVVSVELMRTVDLNLFDLSMWASRPRDEEVIDRSGRWS
jgi:hypothetical protein